MANKKNKKSGKKSRPESIFKNVIRRLFPILKTKKKKKSGSPKKMKNKEKARQPLFLRIVRVLFPKPEPKESRVNFRVLNLLKRKERSEADAEKIEGSPVPEKYEHLEPEFDEDRKLSVIKPEAVDPDITYKTEIKTHLLPFSLFMKLNKLVLGSIVLSVVFLSVLIFEHLSLYPLVETQYNYAEIIGEQHNFVNVIHTRHIDNEKLVESILRKYVIEREQITATPSHIVVHFSSDEVYRQYFGILQKISERNLRLKLRRHIKILRYQKIEKNIRQLEVEFTDLIRKKDQKTPFTQKSTWLINIKFDFSDLKRRYDEVTINPAGLMINRYLIKKLT